MVDGGYNLMLLVAVQWMIVEVVGLYWWKIMGVIGGSVVYCTW